MDEQLHYNGIQMQVPRTLFTQHLGQIQSSKREIAPLDI